MNALPHSPYMRAIVEAQEEAQDDRTDVQKLHDACRRVTDNVARHAALARAAGVDVERFVGAHSRAIERARADLIWLIEKQFGDEVDIELLAKALAS